MNIELLKTLLELMELPDFKETYKKANYIKRADYLRRYQKDWRDNNPDYFKKWYRKKKDKNER